MLTEQKRALYDFAQTQIHKMYNTTDIPHIVKILYMHIQTIATVAGRDLLVRFTIDMIDARINLVLNLVLNIEKIFYSQV